jgi:hypothetical protein
MYGRLSAKGVVDTRQGARARVDAKDMDRARQRTRHRMKEAAVGLTAIGMTPSRPDTRARMQLAPLVQPIRIMHRHRRSKRRRMWRLSSLPLDGRGWLAGKS